MVSRVKETLSNAYKMMSDFSGDGGVKIEYMPDILLHNEEEHIVPHLHSYYEIVWFQEGEGKHMVDFHQYDVKPNSIFLIAPGQIHHFDHNTDYKGVVVKIKPEYMRSSSGSTNFFLKYSAFSTFDNSPCYTIDDSTAEQMAQVVHAMRQEELTPSAFGSGDLQKALVRIALIIVQRYGKQEGAFHLDHLKPTHRLFILFRCKLEHEFTKLHSVTDYAEALSVSPRTLNKSVNECARRTPLSFINERIILEAKRLICFTDLMVKEIAYKLGFEDPSYFVRFFKRQTGVLPTDFRDNTMDTSNTQMD